MLEIEQQIKRPRDHQGVNLVFSLGSFHRAPRRIQRKNIGLLDKIDHFVLEWDLQLHTWVIGVELQSQDDQFLLQKDGVSLVGPSTGLGTDLGIPLLTIQVV